MGGEKGEETTLKKFCCDSEQRKGVGARVGHGYSWAIEYF